MSRFLLFLALFIGFAIAEECDLLRTCHDPTTCHVLSEPAPPFF